MDFKKYPYQDYNSYNLDYILAKVKKAEEEVANIDANITAVVAAKLTEWLNDGTLSNIITNEVLTQIQDNTDDITALDLRMDTAESDITALKSAVVNNSWTGKKTILIGDSYGTGTGGIVGRGWPYYLTELTGMSSIAKYGSGAGFVHTSNGNGNVAAGKTFIDILNDIANGLTASQRAEYELVLVCGGINDRNEDGTDVATNCRQFIRRARNLFVNANVAYLPLHCDSVPNTATFTCYGRLYRAAELEGAKTYYNSIYWLMNTSQGSGDGNHPNDTGYQTIAEFISTWINGGTSEYTIGPGGIGFPNDATVNKSTAYRKNNRVHIDLDVVYTSLAENGRVFTLSSVYYPNVRFWVPVYVYSTDVRYTSMIYIDNDGVASMAPGIINGHRISDITNPRIFLTLDFNIDVNPT